MTILSSIISSMYGESFSSSLSCSHSSSGFLIDTMVCASLSFDCENSDSLLLPALYRLDYKAISSEAAAAVL